MFTTSSLRTSDSMPGASAPRASVSGAPARAGTGTRAATATLVLAGLAAVCITIAHAVHPELDPSWTPISDLAHGSGGWAMTAGFIAWALAGAAAVVAVRPHVRGVTGWIGLVLLAVAAIGPLVAGVFAADPMTTPAGAETVSGTLHAVGAVLPDALLPASVLLAIRLVGRRGPLRSARWIVLGATVAVWIAAIVLTAMMGSAADESGVAIVPGSNLGWANRAHVVACLVYVAALGVAVHRASRAPVSAASLG